MRAMVMIEMVRDRRGVWVAPWEMRPQPDPASNQEGQAAVKDKRSAQPQPAKQSWRAMFRALILAWQGGWPGFRQQAA